MSIHPWRLVKSWTQTFQFFVSLVSFHVLHIVRSILGEVCIPVPDRSKVGCGGQFVRTFLSSLLLIWKLSLDIKSVSRSISLLIELHDGPQVRLQVIDVDLVLFLRV